MTNDVDVIIAIDDSHVGRLTEAFGDGFYADGDMMHDAIRNRSTFNVIHLSTMIKIDLFLPEETPFIQSEWARRRLRKVRVDADRQPVYVASPEDLVIQKLLWYRMTGERSDRQWADVQGILKVQSLVLDYAYLAEWAVQMDLSDLLRRSLEDAGIATTTTSTSSENPV